MSGVAITASKSVQFSVWIFSTISSPPTKSAPAASRFAHFVAGGDDQNLLRLAEAVRQNDGAAHHLVGVLGIDAETHVTSTVSSNLANLTFCSSGTASCSGYGRFSDRGARLGDVLSSFFHCFPRLPPPSADLQAVVFST